jgi:uncharacterized protein with LGFP repeats
MIASQMIMYKANQLGLQFTGPAVSKLETVPHGYRIRFQKADIYFGFGIGAHEVHGAIRDHYNILGGPGSFLGLPTTDETGTPDGVGRYNHFQGGSIYWTPSTGAHAVEGAIRAKWASLGWERSFLGYPVTDETGTPDGVGRFNYFQGGSIYWTPSTGAHAVHGAILAKWASLGWERSFLGYPVTDETGTPDGVGRFNYFQGGSIYWTPSTGAQEVNGPILNEWASLGWERSFLGYPTGDEVNGVQNFQGGYITTNSAGQPYAVPYSETYNSPYLTTNQPLGGSVQVVVTPDGWVTWQSHAHDSGFDNEAYSFVVAMAFPDGHVITLQHSGTTEGTVAGLPFGTPNRDDNYTNTEFNQFIHDHAFELAGVKFSAFLVAQDSTLQAIESYAAGLIGDFVKSFVQQLGQGAATSLESLLI